MIADVGGHRDAKAAAMDPGMKAFEVDETGLIEKKSGKNGAPAAKARDAVKNSQVLD